MRFFLIVVDSNWSHRDVNHLLIDMPVKHISKQNEKRCISFGISRQQQQPKEL